MYCCDHQIKDDGGTEYVARMGEERNEHRKRINPKEAACVIAALDCTAMTKWVLKKFGVTKVD